MSGVFKITLLVSCSLLVIYFASGINKDNDDFNLMRGDEEYQNSLTPQINNIRNELKVKRSIKKKNLKKISKSKTAQPLKKSRKRKEKKKKKEENRDKTNINHKAHELLSNREYRKAVVDVATVIEEEGYDPVELSRMASKYTPYEFISRLPPRLQNKYIKLHRVVKKMRARQLKKDGKNFNSLKVRRIKPPRWIAWKAKKVEAIKVNKRATRFINKISKAAEVKNKNIKRLIALCKKKSPCIVKGVYTWQKNNHHISNKQFKILRSVL